MLDIVIADDDHASLQVLGIFCRERPDLRVTLARRADEARDLVEAGEADVLFTDLRMPGMSGEELLTHVKSGHPHLPVVVMTGYGTIEQAVELLRLGAHDYLTKPLSRDVFLHRLDRVVEQVRLSAEVKRLELEARSGGDPLLGRSPRMTALARQLPTVAATDASVVIYGPSGAGKEVVARSLHRASPRRDRPFVTVNCGALPEQLLESELFGHVQGAFTDARRDHPGLVGAADGGTLLLDEIGEISPAVQVKLLRFLENKEYRPVGSASPRIADVRIIAATHRDLARAVADRSFREDLYYRLNVVPLIVPGLEERREDIPLLARHFLERFNEHFGKRVELTPSAYRHLEELRWPGNVRQLENRIEQLVVMSPEGPVDVDRLRSLESPAPVPVEGSAEPARPESRAEARGPVFDAEMSYREAKAEVLAAFESAYFTRLLEEEGGHLTRVAERAGLDRKNLWQILKRHRIDARAFKRGPRTRRGDGAAAGVVDSGS